jgi:hypothetical protein
MFNAKDRDSRFRVLDERHPSSYYTEHADRPFEPQR